MNCNKSTKYLPLKINWIALFLYQILTNTLIYFVGIFLTHFEFLSSVLAAVLQHRLKENRNVKQSI